MYFNAKEFGKRLQITDIGHGLFTISIHEARMGLDERGTAYTLNFDISIHEARMGLDSNSGGEAHGYNDFNPRGPHGPRP